MAISFQYNHHNLLNRWAMRMGENPWRFNQFEVPDFAPQPAQKTRRPTPYLQKHREELAQALESAFDVVKYYLGYFPKPTFTKDVVLTIKDDEPWWGQTFKIPERHLIQFGKAKYTASSITPDYTQRQSVDSNGNRPPGYQVSLTLPENLASEDRTILKLQDKYRFFLQPPSQYQISSPTWENMLLTQMFATLTDNNGVYTYSFIVPAWDLVNYEGRWEDWVGGTLDKCLDYYDDGYDDGDETWNWGDRDNPVADESAISLKEFSIDGTDAVKLLSAPGSSQTGATVIETPVEPIITNHRTGAFKLKQKAITGSYTEPYAIKVSYLSGLSLMTNSLMDPRIERAIFALANTYIGANTLPVSYDAAAVYEADQEKIYDSEFRVDQAYVNPLGLHKAHIEVWKILSEKADRITGAVYR